MGGFVAMDGQSTRRPGEAKPQQRLTGPHTSATEPARGIAAALNGSPRTQSMMQMDRALAASPRVQRMAVLQRALNAPRDAGSALRAATDSGRGPLPYRASMERAFGQDFSQVRAHFGRAAPLGAIGARAAAHGETIAFAETTPDRETVAHELTHVAQQRLAATGAPARVASASAPAEREAASLAPRAAAGARVDVVAAPGPGLHLVRYKPGDLVMVDGHQARIESLVEPENEIDDLQKYNLTIVKPRSGSKSKSGERMPRVSGARLSPASSSSASASAFASFDIKESASELGGMESGLSLAGPIISNSNVNAQVDPRFQEQYERHKLDLALRLTPLGHDAATALVGSSGNLRGKLAELMVQNILNERIAGEDQFVMQDRKVGVPDEIYGVTSLADIDHMIVDETDDELLRPRALVETKSGTETPEAAKRELVRKFEQLRKLAPQKASKKAKGPPPELYSVDETGKPSEDTVETDEYDFSDLSDMQLLTAGPKRGPMETQYDIQLPFTAEEMQQFTNYVVDRYRRLNG